MIKLSKAWSALKQLPNGRGGMPSLGERFQRPSLMTILIITGMLLVVWLVYEQVIPPIRPYPDSMDLQLDFAAAEIKTKKPPTLENYIQSIGGRPVFKPTRRAFTHKVAPAGTQPEVPLPTSADFTLMGIMGEDEVLEAFIQDRKTGDTHTVSVGQSIGLVLVKKINSRSVILTINGTEIKLGM